LAKGLPRRSAFAKAGAFFTLPWWGWVARERAGGGVKAASTKVTPPRSFSLSFKRSTLPLQGTVKKEDGLFEN
jgi:hypothetical protein